MLIGFVGLTHLGLCTMSACLLKGHKALCLIDPEKKNHIKDIYFEKDLKNILDKKKNNYNLTNSINDFNKCDFVYISQDIPTNHKGVSDLKNITKEINLLLKNLSLNIPIVILSQVPPGFTRKFFKKKLNIYYQVETLIFGSAIERALNPERIILGISEKNQILESKYYNFLKSFNCPIIKMDFESAELTKIAINIYLISSVTVTNMLSNISKLIGSEWDQVVAALKLDRRIGKHAYLSPGLGISGGNLERDLETIKKISLNNSIEQYFFKSFSKISYYMKKWPYKIFIKSNKEFQEIKKIGVLGLSYKENTNSIKNSPSISFIENVKIYSKKNNKEIKIKVYDPVVKNDKINFKVTEASTVNNLIKNIDALFILTPWKEFNLDAKKMFKKSNIKYIVDPYKMIKNSNHLKIKYHTLN